MAPTRYYTKILILALIVAGTIACGQSTQVEKNEPDNTKETSAALYGAFVVLHLEVGNTSAHSGESYYNNGNTNTYLWQAHFWPHLVELVSLADSLNAKLTLLFHLQWFEYIQLDAAKITLVESWEASGHEIGLHHHGFEHADWDGFSDRTAPNVLSHSKYRGTMTDLLTHLKSALAKFTTPPVLSTVTASDRDPDLLKINTSDLFTSTYDAAGHGSDVTSACGPPRRVLKAVSGGSVDSIQVGMAYHAHDGGATHLDSMKALFDNATKTDLIGFVTHAWDIIKEIDTQGGNLNDTDFKRWLDHLAEQRVQARTVKDLVESYQQEYSIEQASPSQILGRW